MPRMLNMLELLWYCWQKIQLADASPDSPVQKACFESSRLFPYTFSETTPQMVQCARSKYWLPGFGGLIQGQIYNPDVVSNSFVWRPNFRMNWFPFLRACWDADSYRCMFFVPDSNVWHGMGGVCMRQLVTCRAWNLNFFIKQLHVFFKFAFKQSPIASMYGTFAGIYH